MPAAVHCRHGVSLLPTGAGGRGGGVVLDGWMNPALSRPFNACEIEREREREQERERGSEIHRQREERERERGRDRKRKRKRKRQRENKGDINCTNAAVYPLALFLFLLGSSINRVPLLSFYLFL